MLPEDDNTAVLKGFGNMREVGKQQRRLLSGTPLGAATKQNERGLGLPPKGKQRREIGIVRNKNAIVGDGSIEDLGVVLRLEADLPHMNGVVARPSKGFRDRRR